MSQPLVTIVTPTYAKPRHFAECAAAVLAQTFTDWVWWVVFNPDCHLDLNQSLGPYNVPSEINAKLQRDPRFVPIIYPIQKSGREKFHVPTRIVNWLYPKVQTPYIYFLADDDLIDPQGLGVLVEAAEPRYQFGNLATDDPGRKPREICVKDRFDVVYGRCDVVTEQPDGTYAHVNWLHPGPVAACLEPGEWDIGLGTHVQPDCLIDGGQVLHTKALWDRATADGWQNDDNPAIESAGHADGTLLNRLAQFARFHYVPQRIVTHRRTSLSTFLKPVVTP